MSTSWTRLSIHGEHQLDQLNKLQAGFQDPQGIDAGPYVARIWEEASNLQSRVTKGTISVVRAH